MVLTAQQKIAYEQICQTAASDLEALDREIAVELNRVRTRLLELQEDKKAVKQILDGASARLGIAISPPLRDLSLSDLHSPVEGQDAQPTTA